MIKSEIINLFQSLQKLGNLSGVKFAYAVSRNIAILKPEVEALNKALEGSDEFKQFDEKRVELAKKHAKKDDKNKPLVNRGQFEIENQEAFDAEFETLKSEHQEVWDARQKQVDDYNDLLKTESELQLYKVSLTDVPVNITVAQMHSISDIVTEEITSPFPVK